MAKYVCSVCGYIYDEATGIPDADIAPGTKWEDLPDDWVCPICGATKAEFEKQGDTAEPAEQQPNVTVHVSTDMRELTPVEICAICTNLARGCEKQYKPEEESLFMELAGYFRSVSAPVPDANYDDLLDLVAKDLEEGFPGANAVAAEVKDRGALRALVWSEKVTRILKSLLTRYQKEGDTMFKNTVVYVCTICGFVYIGDTPPEICPVCKVPNWKFEKVEGRS